MARKIIIEISGGNVQEIYSTEKENDAVAIYVIDWDNINAGEKLSLQEYPIYYIREDTADLLINSANKAIEEISKEYD